MEPFTKAVSQRAYVIIVRFKDNNTAHGGQTVNVTGLHVLPQV